MWSTDARGYTDHIDCNSPALADPVTCTGTVDAPQTLTPAEAVLDVEWKKECLEDLEARGNHR